MSRLAILVTLMLTTAAAPLAALCGVDCEARARPAVNAPLAEAACPLHEQPAPAERRHACDHDHHVAPATAAKADPAVAGRDTADSALSLEQPADVIADFGEHVSHTRLSSNARPRLRLFSLRI